jgi:hypothetical protein
VHGTGSSGHRAVPQSAAIFDMTLTIVTRDKGIRQRHRKGSQLILSAFSVLCATNNQIMDTWRGRRLGVGMLRALKRPSFCSCVQTYAVTSEVVFLDSGAS